MNKKKNYESYDDKKQQILEKSRKLKMEKNEYLKKLTIEYFYGFVKNESTARILEGKRGDKEFLRKVYEELDKILDLERGESVENGAEKGV
ncbi:MULTISPECIES: hypothetical protein [Cetobacterium]|uniref:Uncharacterized protein n=1 Tax=Candidatus Cetobacterium colombiensis TaxID=3073100 RepID=A0ABU4WC29_9FUSO|nr:hypothetical protein [Candidatus Cetobacterium colombiensis]MDX8337098.1 hypothetical protein [Candidatus Cetobacterium colombiensis]